MKILIAIVSCRRDARNGFNQAVRDTWLKDISKFPEVEYKFFIGDNTLASAEEEKAIRESVGNPSDPNRGINYREKCDECARSAAREGLYTPRVDEIVLPVPDDYLHLPVKTREVLRWADERGYDFVYKCDTDTYVALDRLLKSGFEKYDFSGGPSGENVAGGGGWWASRKAIGFVIYRKIDSWAEDCWLSGVLRSQGIPLHQDKRYSDDVVRPTNDLISTHVGFRVGYEVERMYRVHRGMEGEAPKVLITVSGWVTGAKNGDHQAIRETWATRVAKYPNLDYKFFIGDGTPISDTDEALLAPSLQHAGRGHKQKALTTRDQPKTDYAPQDDEILVPCPDGYLYMGHKTWHSHRWALDRGFEHIFQCFPDTFIDVDKLMKSRFEDHSFIGAPIGSTGGKLKFAAGGCGYWLNRKATEIVLATKPDDWAEDRWVGKALGDQGVYLWHDNNYGDKNRQPRTNNAFITQHLCETPMVYNNQMMRDAYAASKTDAPIEPLSSARQRRVVNKTTRRPLRNDLCRDWFDTHPRK
jgi:hypothetical protein